jgi:hypothetical protein
MDGEAHARVKDITGFPVISRHHSGRHALDVDRARLAPLQGTLAGPKAAA